jgi:predicted nucleic acid-binding protein
LGELTSVVHGKLVAFDTAPIIYYLEEHTRYLAPVEEVFSVIRQRLAQGLTSVLTLVEVLVKPLREGQHDLANEYRRLLAGTRGLILYPATQSICERAALVRSTHKWLRTPDALQVATALEYGAHMIVTNDERWRRLTEIPVVILRDYMPAEPDFPKSKI